MTHKARTLWVGLAWLSSATALFWFAGSTSLAGWALLAVGGVLPPLVYAALDNDGPPQTIAQVLYETEKGR